MQWLQQASFSFPLRGESADHSVTINCPKRVVFQVRTCDIRFYRKNQDVKVDFVHNT